MTRILILYGTTDGQTAKVARFVGEVLRARGATVDGFDAAIENPDPAGYDGVIVAGSAHAGGYQRSVVRWARSHKEALRREPSAFISVCLAGLQESAKVTRELETIVGRFETATGWKPDQVKIVAGALRYTRYTRYTRYGWLKRLVMRRIARKAGGATDTSRDHEYTDWGDLRAFAGSFYSRCAPEAPARCASRTTSACVCASATITD